MNATHYGIKELMGNECERIFALMSEGKTLEVFTVEGEDLEDLETAEKSSEGDIWLAGRADKLLVETGRETSENLPNIIYSYY